MGYSVGPLSVQFTGVDGSYAVIFFAAIIYVHS